VAEVVAQKTQLLQTVAMAEAVLVVELHYKMV
jgi:hypothetical protein